MRIPKRLFSKGSLLFTAVLLTFTSPIGASDIPTEIQGIGITEHMGESVELDLQFRDESGATVTLGSYFNQKRPVILALVYYECPHLCNLLLNGLQEALRTLDWTTGNQFDLVAVSINPSETPDLAFKKKQNYLKIYGRPDGDQGWHFLTGEQSQIEKLASQVGFSYRYDENEKQYAHAAALYILTAQGKISQYLYGVSFKAQNLKFSLLNASNGNVGTLTEQVLLFCFHFDPNRNSYTLHMWRIVQAVLCFQVIALFGLLYYLWKKDKRTPV